MTATVPGTLLPPARGATSPQPPSGAAGTAEPGRPDAGRTDTAFAFLLALRVAPGPEGTDVGQAMAARGTGTGGRPGAGPGAAAGPVTEEEMAAPGDGPGAVGFPVPATPVADMAPTGAVSPGQPPPGDGTVGPGNGTVPGRDRAAASGTGLSPTGAPLQPGATHASSVAGEETAGPASGAGSGPAHEMSREAQMPPPGGAPAGQAGVRGEAREGAGAAVTAQAAAHAMPAAQQVAPSVNDGREPDGFLRGAPLSPDAPDWGDALGERVLWMAGREGGRHQALLRLNPPQLGTLEVRVQVADGQAAVSFHAHHPEVRDAIHAAIPRLREMLADAGLQLADAQVSGGGAGGERSASEGGDRTSSALPAGVPAEASPDGGGAAAASAAARGLLDLYA